MNARKYAWQILHARIRQMSTPDEGMKVGQQSHNIAALMTKAAKEGIDDNHLILSLAEFGAIIMLMHSKNAHVITCPSCGKPMQIQGGDPIEVAKAMEQQVMSEPD